MENLSHALERRFLTGYESALENGRHLRPTIAVFRCERSFFPRDAQGHEMATHEKGPLAKISPKFRPRCRPLFSETGNLAESPHILRAQRGTSADKVRDQNALQTRTKIVTFVYVM